MEHRVSLIALLLMLSSIPFHASAYDFSAVAPSGQTLYYSINYDDMVAVVRPGTGSEYNNYVTGDLVIPDSVTYNGVTYAVTSLGYGSFEDCNGLTSVTIPETVYLIGFNAFWGCGGLTSVNIGAGVTQICQDAFRGCGGLSITIPNSVTSIGVDAFYEVKYIEYHGSATGAPWGARLMNRVTEGDFAFTDSTKRNLLAYLGAGGDVVIPSSVDTIGEQAFSACSSLTSVTIGNSVTSIGFNAFNSCSNLTSVTISNSVTSIGGWAFGHCDSLVNINIPNSVTYIGDHAFYDCRSLTSITIPEGVTELIGTFDECMALSSVVLPNSITTIGDNTFNHCSGLTSIMLHEGVQSIGHSAFQSCSNLSSISLPSSLKSIGEWAFDGCGLVSITIPDSVLLIKEGAFYACHELVNVTLPESLDSIGGGVFAYCRKLSSVNIPPKIKAIAGGLFVCCDSLTNIIIPDSVRYIGEFAFFRSGLRTVTIPKGVKYIREGAFRECNNLDTMFLKPLIPPVFVEGSYSQWPTIPYNTVKVIYSCAYEAYSNSMWSNYLAFFSVIDNEYVLNCISENEVFGEAVIEQQYCDSNIMSVIHAVPNYGYHFRQWNDGDTNNPRVVTLTQDTTISAIFAKNIYNVAVSSADTVRGGVTGGTTTEYLDTVSLTATSNYGYHFTQWSDGITDNPRMVQVTRDSIFTAQFDYNQYGIALAVDTTIHGSVSGAGDYNYLSARTIAATANYGYHFIQWNDGDTNNPRTLTLTQDTAFTALFAKNTYSIAALSTDTVKGYAGGTDTLEYLDTAILTATANYGYHFTQWSDGITDNPRMVQVTRDSIFTAQFDYNQYSISLAVDTTIHGSVVGAGSYNYLSNRTISATPNYGYHFTQWSDGDTTNPRTFTLTQDTTFTALFTANQYYVTATCNDTARGSVLGSDSVAYLDTITLIAVPNYGYHLNYWRYLNDNGSPVTLYGMDTIQLEVTRNMSVTAYFTYNQYNISLAVDTAIHGSVSGAGDYNYLSAHTIAATPNYGYHFTQWNDGDSTNPRVITLTQDTTFTAMFAKNLYDVAALSADTIRGSVTGSTTAEYLDTITMTAAPNYGYHFTQWNDGDTNNPRTFTLTQDTVFTALFARNSYDITLMVDTAIHGSVTGAGTYEYLDNRSICVTANYGYHFTQWNDGDTTNPRVITLTQDTAFTAMFAKNLYDVAALSADSIRGSVTGSTTAVYLDTITMTAAPNYGYHFTQWNDGNTSNPRVITLTQDTVFTALFAKNSYDITLSVDTAIHGSVTGAGTYEYLDSRSLSATANYGYHFTVWNDGDTNNPRVITLTQDTMFTALFAKNTYTLTLQSNDTTLGEVLGGGMYEYLDTVSITASTLMSHHHFVQWSDGSTEATRSVVVTQDSLISATFAIDTHMVTLAVNDDLYGTVSGMGAYPYGSDVVIEATAAEGYHFAQWSNGSRSNPDTITVLGDTMLTAIFTDDVVPEICMVTVQNGRNTVLWDKGLEVTAYNIYRESTVVNEYELAATVPYDSLSMWVDTASRPATRSYRYRMTATDLYGYESEAGSVHKTMHLTISQGIGNRWNLVWTEYEGADYTTYVIYRGTHASNIQQIDVMPSGSNTYTDEEAPDGDVYYQVGVMMTTPCNPTKAATISRSNIATNSTVGIEEVGSQRSEVSVYAVEGKIVVEGAEGETVRVYDVTGRMVQAFTHSSHQALPAGVYMVKVSQHPARKVVVLR
ncbi:MAG: leucine-rich repeat domain-containing protein [Bacteroidales bacterium]|nr:leucine-rich repeat domain-containing protein [Bacteroidales bacterium]